MLVAQYTNSAVTSSSLTHHLANPVTQCETPVSCHEDTTDNIDNLNQEGNNTITTLMHRQQNGLDIVLDEDTGDPVVANLLALLRHGILVRNNLFRADAVDCRDDGEVVLELVEVGAGKVDGSVERVDKRWVERAVGELGNDVGEVKVCTSQSMSLRGSKQVGTYCYGQDARQPPCIRDLAP
jgi:hypothetical protein